MTNVARVDDPSASDPKRRRSSQAADDAEEGVSAP
jgi:hypothetical protein